MDIVFDSGVLISFSETCFLPLFKRLRNKIGKFIITKSVKFECVEKVQNVMRFKLSSIRIEDQINNFIFDVYEGSKELNDRTQEILSIVNNMFFVRGNPLNIIHMGEAESIALLGLTDAKCLAIDERTTRMLIEQPNSLLDIFRRKYNCKNIKFDKKKYLKFKNLIGDINVVRSVDLLAYAYKNSLLSNLIDDKESLKAVLYAMKFKGCSVSFEEINEYINLL